MAGWLCLATETQSAVYDIQRRWIFPSGKRFQRATSREGRPVQHRRQRAPQCERWSCPPARTVGTHVAQVTCITDSYYLTLIMCRYSASSMSKLAASSSSGESRRNSGPTLGRATFLEELQGKRSWLAAQNSSQNRAPSRSRDRCDRIFPSCSKSLNLQPQGLPRHAVRQSFNNSTT